MVNQLGDIAWVHRYEERSGDPSNCMTLLARCNKCTSKGNLYDSRRDDYEIRIERLPIRNLSLE